jgi:hypothetical protein
MNISGRNLPLVCAKDEGSRVLSEKNLADNIGVMSPKWAGMASHRVENFNYRVIFNWTVTYSNTFARKT